MLKNKIDRRSFLGAVSAGAAGVAGFSPLLASASDAAYPSKGPIKLIVPLPPGGAADATARMVGAQLQTQLKQTVFIENKAGGNYTVGMQAIALSPADGYTLMYIHTGICSTQASLKKIDLLKTLKPVSLMGTMPCVLCVSPKSTAKTVKELVAYGQANPGKLSYGSSGIGGFEHLWTSNFGKANNLDAAHIPFKNNPEAGVAMASDEVQYAVLLLAVALPMIQKGLVRPLALLAEQRHPALADLPTLKEAGYNAPPVIFWGGIMAPAGTPDAVVETLRAEIVTALKDPSLSAKLTGIGTAPKASETSQSFGKLIEDELRWMDAAVKAANLQLT